MANYNLPLKRASLTSEGRKSIAKILTEIEKKLRFIICKHL